MAPAGVLDYGRAASRQVASGAATKPAANGSDIKILGDGPFAGALRNEPTIELRSFTDVIAGDHLPTPRRQRFHTLGTTDCQAQRHRRMARQVEELFEIGALVVIIYAVVRVRYHVFIV